MHAARRAAGFGTRGGAVLDELTPVLLLLRQAVPQEIADVGAFLAKVLPPIKG